MTALPLTSFVIEKHRIKSGKLIMSSLFGNMENITSKNQIVVDYIVARLRLGVSANTVTK